ncbi:cytochrome c oxidase assembly factor 5-like [Mobula hypostoma]|uniref:cytochrome c oxidase assembly factor 5-like n=1 Tax=Mobula hypostoma TaxID=723540 RepID=UPI002FC3CE20
MPKYYEYYEDKEEDGAPCSGVEEDLRSWLLGLGCVLKEGKTPKQCMKEGHWQALQLTFFECKKSMLVNRTRFRGKTGY